MQTKWLTLLTIVAVIVWFVGCEGPEGPQGEQGTQGPLNPGYTYLGDDANTCNHCHDGTVAAWEETHHAEAYAALEMIGQHEDPYCLQCHTTGWDAEVTYEGDDPIITPGSDLNGFDDYWPPASAEDEERIEALKNVQCESCHGAMGPTIYDHSPMVNFNTGLFDDSDPSMCSKCHEQVEEWQESGHGLVLEHHGMTLEEFNDEWNSFSSCWECHTAEGFVSANDEYWAAEGRPEQAHMISCQTCHDPHDATNDHHLRNLDPVTVAYDTVYAATFEGYETAQICAQCHHARRSNSNVVGQIENGYAHFGPHGSPQMDMAVGSGSYEIAGYDYDRDHAHQSLAESCVTCHMTTREHSDPLGWKGGHDFEPSVIACQPCHAELTEEGNFDHGGGVTEINELLVQLQEAIGPDIDPEDYGDAEVTTPEQRMAAYAYVFVMNDGSHGVHNPEYAESLLENAIDFMQAENAKNLGPWARK